MATLTLRCDKALAATNNESDKVLESSMKTAPKKLTYTDKAEQISNFLLHQFLVAF